MRVRSLFREYMYLQYQKYLGKYSFVHINKCGGTSVERAFGIPKIHDTAQQRIEKIGGKAWRRMYTFSVVRNPYEKIISHYRYRVKTGQTGMGDSHISLNDWIKNAYWLKDERYYDNPLMFSPCATWLVDGNNNLLVNEFFQLEKLSESWSIIQKQTGCRAALMHENKTANYEAEHKDMLSLESVDIINRLFDIDFHMFGYDKLVGTKPD